MAFKTIKTEIFLKFFSHFKKKFFFPKKKFFFEKKSRIRNFVYSKVYSNFQKVRAGGWVIKKVFPKEYQHPPKERDPTGVLQYIITSSSVHYKAQISPVVQELTYFRRPSTITCCTTYTPAQLLLQVNVPVYSETRNTPPSLFPTMYCV